MAVALRPVHVLTDAKPGTWKDVSVDRRLQTGAQGMQKPGCSQAALSRLSLLWTFRFHTAFSGTSGSQHVVPSLGSMPRTLLSTQKDPVTQVSG